MNRKALTVLVTTLAVLVAAFSFSAAAQQADEPVTTSSPVYRFSDSQAVENADSQLTRFANGVTTVINTSGLDAGSVYTLWWVIFNEPENCSGGVCNMDDIFQLNEDGSIVRDEVGNRALNMDGLQAANISIQHASGTFTADGSLSLSASLGLGDVPGIIVGPGLLDAHKAEIHLVVRTHGAKLADAFNAQVSTFGGGCEPIDAAPCDDVQFAMHLPQP